MSLSPRSSCPSCSRLSYALVRLSPCDHSCCRWCLYSSRAKAGASGSSTRTRCPRECPTCSNECTIVDREVLRNHQDPPPNGPPAAAVAFTLFASTRFKTVLCRNLVAGRPCSYGDQCKFAHAEEEIRRKGIGGDKDDKVHQTLGNKEPPATVAATAGTAVCVNDRAAELWAARKQKKKEQRTKQENARKRGQRKRKGAAAKVKKAAAAAAAALLVVE